MLGSEDMRWRHQGCSSRGGGWGGQLDHRGEGGAPALRADGEEHKASPKHQRRDTIPLQSALTTALALGQTAGLDHGLWSRVARLVATSCMWLLKRTGNDMNNSVPGLQEWHFKCSVATGASGYCTGPHRSRTFAQQEGVVLDREPW